MPHIKNHKHSKLLSNIEDTPELMMSRKNDHIRICKTEKIESDGEPFSQFHFIPEALPEINFNDLDLTQKFLNQSFAMPLLVTGMTGGVEKGQEINEAIALAAEKFNIPMGLGSQKMLIKNSKFKKLFDVRKIAPNLFVIGNIGAVSLNYGITLEDIKRLVDDLELGAFAIHLNALQECIQPEGERNFSQLLAKIEKIARNLHVPVIIKEVGSGISSETYQKLVSAGVAAVDVGGKGGTSWSAIEGLRSDKEGQRLGDLFKNWGLSTDDSLLCCSRLKSDLKYNVPLIATGGIRNGLQVAKAVALGASMVGVGLPLFKAAVSPLTGETPLESVERELNFFRKSLSITMFCAGAHNLTQLNSRIVQEVP
ncbi:type 2 isopentenyl-diphosphate Delta-isomerase [Fluviispira sanaruensis]|uniref:Isopentenyl-diphosphate delta-isomerase n=1 Tax=Fluviispira sanaruensis TaxID=2493639 RepID=A0A4P2VTZ6_FLUSA|nr:type 2 isopentenyl-diphosphate Delta-isomerase [Fluviispira sanaruensis]BBH52362.1 type 2 isopentenyl-diphosphate Delta-isomerase [Fluviispira sanaruensis]